MLHRTARPLLVIALAVLTALGTASPATAATGGGSVSGRVVDSSGAGVPGLTVELATGGPDPDEPYRSYSVKTDASGAYALAGVVPAHYVLLEDEPDWFAARDRAVVAVPAGATTTAPVLTVLRAAAVRGRLVSSADGAPVAGLGVDAGGPVTTTDGDGGFSLRVRPGTVRVTAVDRFWFLAERTAAVPEAGAVDLGTIALDPAGLVTTSLVEGSGRAIGTPWRAAVVDGCRVTDLHGSTCPGVALHATVAGLQLRPGPHTIGYEVRSPVTAAVRRVTRNVDVAAGAEDAVPQIVFPVVDPARRTAVERSVYRRGHPVVVRVIEGAYVDGARPRLPVTVRVSGHVVRPVSIRWRTRPNGVRVLVATLPARLSAHRSLKVRAIVHGDGTYSGQSSAATTLTRTR